MRLPTSALVVGMFLFTQSNAATVLFNFDNATVRGGLPADLSASGITAHLSATGQGFSFQAADVLGFTPAGFSGLCVYPSSVYAADLLISFSQPLTGFSILYAPEEYGCDNSATMRATGYMGTSYVTTSTATAPSPGTWPSGTLTLNAAQNFDHVVVHYDTRPSTCTDVGPVFMADNMNVTPANASVEARAKNASPPEVLISTDPLHGQAFVRFTLLQSGPILFEVYDGQGRLVRTIAALTVFESGIHELRWDGRNDRGREATPGAYLCRLTIGMKHFSARMVILGSSLR